MGRVLPAAGVRAGRRADPRRSGAAAPTCRPWAQLPRGPIELATGDARSVDAHDGTVYAVAWTPDGARLATGGNDNTVRLWDPEHLEPLLELRGHEQYVKAIAFSPDGTMLASGSGDGTVRLWDAAPRALRQPQLRERRALRDEIRPRVDAWFAEGLSAEEVVARVVDAWGAEDPRRWAGFEVVAAR